MKCVFTIPERVHGGTSVKFVWQQLHGNFLASSGSKRAVTIYNRSGELKDEILLPGNCNGLAWDKDGDTLAIINDKSGIIHLWDANTFKTTQLESGLRDTLTFLAWSTVTHLLVIGTLKGNVLIYNHQTSRKIPILGKHSRKITCGAWNSEGLLALGGEDRVITISNSDGDTIRQANTRLEPSEMRFSVMKTDERAGPNETTVSMLVGKKTLLLYNLNDPDNPVELAFQPRYGTIVTYRWFGDGYIMIGFSAGFLIVISTHLKEIGQELFQTRDHKDDLYDVSVSLTLRKAACCGDKCIKIHDLADMTEITSIIELGDLDGQLDKVSWTEDGQLLAISTDKGAIHVYLTKLPILGDATGTKIAYLTSLREVSIIDDVNQDQALSVSTDVEPSFIGIGPYHLAVGMNNRVWFSNIANGNVAPLRDREYLGNVILISLNHEYAAAMFDGKVQLHLIEGEGGEGEEEREAKLFPDNDTNQVITCMSLTADFLVYGTDKGNISYFFLEDWKYVNEFHHLVGIRMLFCDPTGTRLIFVDDKGDAYIFNPVNDALLEVASFPPSARKVLWDNWLIEKGMFCAHDDDKVYTYVFSMDTMSGPNCTLTNTTRLSFEHCPLMLYEGELTCQSQSGKLSKLMISVAPLTATDGTTPTDAIDGLENLLVTKRFTDAWNACILADDRAQWTRLAEAAAKQLDIALATKVYRKLSDVAMVLSLEKVKQIEDKNLLAGYVAMFLCDYNLAQDLFLASSYPKATLDMRKDLLHWDQALELAKTLDPEQIPFISKEYGQQLEFVGDYPNALMYFERGVTNDPEYKDHDDTCQGGVARMAIRLGDIARGVSIARKSNSILLKKECASLLENMKQYTESAALYEQAQNWDKAATVYMKLKDWNKVGELLQYVTSSKLLLQYAKAKEADGRYKEALTAYRAAKDHLSIIRVCLDHLNKPEEAVAVVKETQSVDGAKLVAAFFQKLGDFTSAIQFLVLSRCNNEAFQLAQQHQQMEIYADTIGDTASKQEYNSIALYFENEQNHLLAGKFHLKSGQHSKSLQHLMRCKTSEDPSPVQMAIECVAAAQNEQLVHQLIDYLMGEDDGIPKDAKYLFQLYMALERYPEAAKTAVIIARDDQESGNYRNAHDVLFGMYRELRNRNIRIPSEMSQNLLLLHSYILAKIHIKRGDHGKGARMLTRVADNISKFPGHIVPILTSTVIECHRAGMKRSSFSYAAMLMRPEYRQKVDLKYRKKIEQIVRKPDKSEEDEPCDPCPFCSYSLPQTRLDCPECKNAIPYCVVTGRHMIKSDWCVCPHCLFPAICSEFKHLLDGNETTCPMCSEKVTITSLQPVADPSVFLKIDESQK